MNVQPLRFDVSVTLEDLTRIRQAIRAWGKPGPVAANFDGAVLYDHFLRWEDFVETNWCDWDISEYDHDLGCRVWIQVAIEHSTPETGERLLEAVHPLDEQFRAKMKPRREARVERVPILRQQPYFWDTHVIHPRLTRTEPDPP